MLRIGNQMSIYLTKIVLYASGTNEEVDEHLYTRFFLFIDSDRKKVNTYVIEFAAFCISFLHIQLEKRKIRHIAQIEKLC